jgi:hypothetical protein
MKRYVLTVEVESESDPRDWTLQDSLIIDGPYEILKVEEGE